MTDRIINVRYGNMVPGPFTYVGRTAGGWLGSPLGNPFKASRERERRGAVASYAIHLADHPELIGEIVAIAARDNGDRTEPRAFGCWCAPKLCHGEVVADLYDLSRAGVWLADLQDRARLLATWIEFGGRYPFSEPPDPVAAVPEPLPLVGV